LGHTERDRAGHLFVPNEKPATGAGLWGRVRWVANAKEKSYTGAVALNGGIDDGRSYLFCLFSHRKFAHISTTNPYRRPSFDYWLLLPCRVSGLLS
jgi:hypothetical protein